MPSLHTREAESSSEKHRAAANCGGRAHGHDERGMTASVMTICPLRLRASGARSSGIARHASSSLRSLPGDGRDGM